MHAFRHLVTPVVVGLVVGSAVLLGPRAVSAEHFEPVQGEEKVTLFAGQSGRTIDICLRRFPPGACALTEVPASHRLVIEYLSVRVVDEKKKPVQVLIETVVNDPFGMEGPQAPVRYFIGPGDLSPTPDFRGNSLFIFSQPVTLRAGSGTTVRANINRANTLGNTLVTIAISGHFETSGPFESPP